MVIVSHSNVKCNYMAQEIISTGAQNVAICYDTTKEIESRQMSTVYKQVNCIVKIEILLSKCFLIEICLALFE